MRTHARHSALDSIDIAILEALQAEGRLSVSALGRRVGLSQPATSERLKRLEEGGVILGYRAVIDPAALGLHMMAVIRLRTTHDHIRACQRQFASMPEVIEVLRLTGEDCFFLYVIVPSPAELESIVDGLARHGAVTTSLVLRREPGKALTGAILRKSNRSGVGRRSAAGPTRRRP